MDRRRFLAMAGIGTSALLSDRMFSYRMFASGGAAGYGVASGDPTQDSVVLWTKLPDDIAIRDAEHQITVLVSLDESFSDSKIVRRAQKLISAATDFCCKICVDGLPQNQWLYYRFMSDSGYVSDIGRTKTLPSTDIQQFRFAVVSCQDFSTGFYNVYEKIILLDLDFIIHLGDHIYESAEKSYDKNYVRHDHIGESETLDQYREKYKLYLTDDRLRAVRARFPFISIWDDHEVFNDYAGADLEVEGARRQSAGYRAFLEYTPINIDENELHPKLYHSFAVGNLARFIAIDQRQYRTKQPCEHKILTRGCTKQFSSSQTMLGERQFSWFLDELSENQNMPTFVLSEVMFSPFLVPAGLGKILGHSEDSKYAESDDGSQKFYMSLDSWDGYAFERQKIIDHINQQDLKNIVICTGDIHNFYRTNVYQDPINAKGKIVAREFVTGSITSNGIGDYVGGGLSRVAKIMIHNMNDHFEYSELDHHGCLIFEVTRSNYKVTALAVTTTKATASRAVTLYSNQYDLI